VADVPIIGQHQPEPVAEEPEAIESTGKTGRDRMLEIMRREIPAFTIGLPHVEYDTSLCVMPQPDGRLMPAWFVMVSCGSPIIGEINFSTTILTHPRPPARGVAEALRQLGKGLRETYDSQLQSGAMPNGVKP